MNEKPPPDEGNGPADEPSRGEEEEDRLRRRQEQFVGERSVRLRPGGTDERPEGEHLERMSEYRKKQRRKLEEEGGAGGDAPSSEPDEDQEDEP